MKHIIVSEDIWKEAKKAAVDLGISLKQYTEDALLIQIQIDKIEKNENASD